MNYLKLYNGVEMPQLGFGVFQVSERETVRAVLAALECGYRLIDTAQAYGHRQKVRQIRRAGRPALEHTARRCGDTQIHARRAHQREFRRVRLCADRRGHGGNRGDGHRPQRDREPLRSQMDTHAAQLQNLVRYAARGASRAALPCGRKRAGAEKHTKSGAFSGAALLRMLWHCFCINVHLFFIILRSFKRQTANCTGDSKSPAFP